MVLATSFVFFAVAGLASAAVTKRTVCPSGQVTANAAVGRVCDEVVISGTNGQYTVLRVLRSPRRPARKLVRQHMW